MKTILLPILILAALVGCDQVKLADIKKSTAPVVVRGNNPNADQVFAYVTENNVVNWQLDYTATPKDVQTFSHKHVLRGELPFVNSNLLDSTISVPYLADSVQKHKALLEYFTGHRCGNCPSQSNPAFTDIESNFSSQVSVIKIHAGFFAEPKSATAANYTYDFRCKTGDDIYNNYGITSVPIAMINRKDFPGLSRLISPSSWTSQISEELKISSKYGIWENHTYDSTSRSIKVNALVKDQESRTVYSVVFDGKIDALWKSKNCSIVIVVYNKESKNILQSRTFELK